MLDNHHINRDDFQVGPSGTDNDILIIELYNIIFFKKNNFIYKFHCNFAPD